MNFCRQKKGIISNHVWGGCSPNEDYVAFLVRKLVEWYSYASGPAREGRAPLAGNDGVNDEAVEDWMGERGADDV